MYKSKSTKNMTRYFSVPGTLETILTKPKHLHNTVVTDKRHPAIYSKQSRTAWLRYQTEDKDRSM